MRTLIHISDLHFGRIDAKSTKSLSRAFAKIHPDLVIISGDISQRAKKEEFLEAKKFLNELSDSGIKYLVLPGNHDIEPFFKPIRRTIDPYKNYKKYISETIESYYSDNEIAVASINTSRNFNIKNGNVSTSQIKTAERWFSLFSPKIFKIVVTHHPFDLPIERHKGKLARRASRGVEMLSHFNIDLYLSGHLHQSSVVTTEERYSGLEYAAIALQAGTLSERQRGEVESFNVIKINKPNLSIDTYLWDSESNLFTNKMSNKFKLIKKTWKKIKPEK